MTAPALSPLLTVQQVAAVLQVPLRTVYDWHAAGRLPSVKLGRLVRFRPDAIERWIAEHSSAPVDLPETP